MTKNWFGTARQGLRKQSYSCYNSLLLCADDEHVVSLAGASGCAVGKNSCSQQRRHKIQHPPFSSTLSPPHPFFSLRGSAGRATGYPFVLQLLLLPEPNVTQNAKIRNKMELEARDCKLRMWAQTRETVTDIVFRGRQRKG